MQVEVFDERGRSRARRRRASSCARRPSPRCRSASGTTRTAAATAPPTSRSIPGVWSHGDFAELTAHDGMIIHGRSDAVLNPGGVRIGTAEIYRQVESHRRGAREPRDRAGSGRTTCAWCCSCACARASRSTPGCASASGAASATTRRRVTCPRRSCRWRTFRARKSGKIVELAVRDVVHGRPVANREALAESRGAGALFAGTRGAAELGEAGERSAAREALRGRGERRGVLPSTCATRSRAKWA